MTETQQIVPFIQTSDLNDGDILNQTRKLSAGNGIMLEYTLPSGQVLKSDAVQPDMIGKAMIGWIDAVKARIVEDAQSAADAALRKAREAAMAGPSLDTGAAGTDKDEAWDTGALGRDAGHVRVSPPPSEPPAAAYEALGLSPKTYARSKVRELKETVRMLRKAIKQRQASLAEAQRALGEWEGVVAGLTRKRA